MVHTELMADEIERKFLVGELPPRAQLGNGVHIRQGYLAAEGRVEVRMRITESASVVTIKAGAGLRRVEVELATERTEADALWPSTEGRQLEKTRYRVPVDGLTAEVDVFAGALDGLVVVEVEFDSEDAAGAFRPPPW